MEFSSNTRRYGFSIYGDTALLCHRDNIAFCEKVKAWQKDPQNKQLSVAGDDRSPAWTWLGYLYTDGKHITMSSDCLTSCLTEGAGKVPTGNTKGDKSYKKLLMSGMTIEQPELDFFINGKQIPIKPFNDLIGVNDFEKHVETVEKHNFEFLIKRAKIGMGSKHVRVRPLFHNWTIKGTLLVFDEEMSQLTQPIIEKIFEQAGFFCGLGDWRPSSKKPGQFGKFHTEITPIALG